MSNVVSDLVKDVPIPRMFKVRQYFTTTRIAPEDIPGVIRSQLQEEKYTSQLKPGMRIAITVGSRQIANIIPITKTLVDFLKEKGCKPFIVAAMGSHGGATEEGQRGILANFGVTEESMGCPIKCHMDVVKIGVNEEGKDVLIGKDSAEADGIIVNCRVKPHTGFRGRYESGIMKMMTIGLGKQAGAQICHEEGFANMAKNIPLFGKAIIKNANILFAVATIENAYDETSRIVVVNHDEIEEVEPHLLEDAKRRMGKIYIPECDVLVVDEIGKNISGSGYDPNVTGNFVTPYASGGLKSQRTAVLDLSEGSHHSGCGLGMAHATTRRCMSKVDLDQTYPNLITSRILENARIPMIMKNDKEAIQVCIKACVGVNRDRIRIIRIINTLKLEHILLSEAYYDELRAHPIENLEIESEPRAMEFDQDGNLIDLEKIY
jgi:hypothetical protein